MHIVAKNILTTLFYINLLASILAKNCYLDLSNHEWNNEWRLIITESSNNKLDLLRDRSVAGNTRLDMFCKSSPKLIQANCNRNGAFDKKLPIETKCDEAHSLQPLIATEKVTYCPYTLYKVGFNIRYSTITKFFEIYQVCFDPEHMRTLFTINTAYPVAGKRPEDASFTTDDIFSNPQANAYYFRSYFQRFKQLLGEKQTYMQDKNADHRIDRGHLSPSADFSTMVLKLSTFKLINVTPQFKTIDNGNWRLIEEWSRDRSRTPANICTGVLDCKLDSDRMEDLNCILKLKHVNGHMVPMFLADTRKIPIPLWIYKIVSGKDGKRTVFLTYNNIFHQGTTVSCPTDICKEQTGCPSELKKTIKDGFTFCCEYNTFIEKAVPYLKGKC